MNNELLTMRHISKTFPGVQALNDVNFTLCSGEIHAIMGENGAGKSTLIKVLTGVEEFEQGEILVSWLDHPLINHSPQEAQRNGSVPYIRKSIFVRIYQSLRIFLSAENRKKEG